MADSVTSYYGGLCLYDNFALFFFVCFTTCHTSWSFMNYHHDIPLGPYLFGKSVRLCNPDLLQNSAIYTIFNRMCAHVEIRRKYLLSAYNNFTKIGMLCGLLLFGSLCVDLLRTYSHDKLFNEYIFSNCYAIIYFILKVYIYFVNVSWCC